MELNQLRYFKKVAQTGSVTRAAQELYISQSTLSQCLARLEESVGCSLFLRQPGKPMALTEAGELFAEVVDQVLLELDTGTARVRALARRSNMQVSIATSIYDICNEILREYFSHHAWVNISHRMISVNSLSGMLLDNEADFAISPCPLTDERLDCRPLYIEESLAVVGPKHPLRGAKHVDLDALRSERFLCNLAEADRLFLDMLFGDDSVNVVMESNEPDMIRNLVDRGAGVAFVPARIVMRRVLSAGDSPDQFIRIRGFRFTVPTCITKKKTRRLSGDAAQLYDYVADYCEKESRQAEQFLKKYYG